MVFLDLASRPPQTPVLHWSPIWLRPTQFSDFAAWRVLRDQSRDHLTAWEPALAPGDMTPEAFRRRVRAQWREIGRGTAAPFVILREADDALVGAITLSNIRYGASRSASLGYWIGAPFTRRGYARAALAATLDHAFRALNLNRVEAACQPENLASRRLLEATAFVLEGRARRYLRINNFWRDHLLFAITSDEFAISGRN
jgi:ribosomal-protein-alanine N-acetyltransferase